MEITIFFILFFILPQALMFAGFESTSFGFFLSLVLVSFINILKGKRYDQRHILLLLFLSIYGLCPYFFNLNQANLNIKVILEFFLLAACILLLNTQLTVDNIRLKKFTHLMIFFVVASGFYEFELSIANKPIFPFIEPSHFSIFLGYLFAFNQDNQKEKLALLLCMIFIGFFHENTTSLFISIIFLMYEIILFSKIRNLFFYVPIISIFGFLLINGELVNSKYFFDRATFDGDNLTALVYLSGWENIFYTFNSGNYFGHGFASLGNFIFPNSYSEIVTSIVGFNLNAFDGSFIFSKLFFQFGLLSIFYLILLARFVIISITKSNMDSYLSVVFLFEFFMRSPGINYGGFLLMSIFLLSNKNEEKNCS